MNYLFGLLLGKYENDGTRKFIVRLAAVCNLGILFFYKYFEFLTTAINNLFLGIGWGAQLSVPEIILPVGVSFFTFQAMSYVIDVYRKELPSAVSLMDTMLYISFFPQLVAGPIVRAKDFLPQLLQAPDPKQIRGDKAFLLITSGLFKKLIIANYLSTLFVDRIFEHPAGHSPLVLLLGVYGYAVQIYCDFSAYSDIAIGVAELFGYQFTPNFKHPYRAASLREFWKRWHISLSTWLRDYLYIPLGGSKKGKVRTYINLLLTMVLGGIWHGAAWQFFVWGALHGLGLCVERLFVKKEKEQPQRLIFKIIGTFFTFHFVCLCWVFFRAGSIELAFEYLKALFSGSTDYSLLTPFVFILIVCGLVIHFLPARLGNGIQALYNKMPLVLQGVLVGLFLIMLGALSPDGVAPFIYFQF